MGISDLSVPAQFRKLWEWCLFATSHIFANGSHLVALTPLWATKTGSNNFCTPLSYWFSESWVRKDLVGTCWQAAIFGSKNIVEEGRACALILSLIKIQCVFCDCRISCLQRWILDLLFPSLKAFSIRACKSLSTLLRLQRWRCPWRGINKKSEIHFQHCCLCQPMWQWLYLLQLWVQSKKKMVQSQQGVQTNHWIGASRFWLLCER